MIGLLKFSLGWQPETYFHLPSVYQLKSSDELSDVVFIFPLLKERKYLLMIGNEKW